ncbi:ATP-dependent helicase HrpB [Pelosinus sp. IPA-1]|uniref:ATP-dependent helicase HrpB n=1 Tax=Pelosinus sp. IPA-1 TaxID=3029569 RepID=UPI0024362AED|nr:ATP-dependent helicase HrpB [Pelosinus sp. IPA-1]GMA99043.1 ATP-dependent helicase HrpB [Pelosinus sp. IPA-1]
MKKLPIEDILLELQTKLSTSKNIVLVAPPGAGKTTRIPLALLDEPWLLGQRILLLEPRRLAARAAARYMAALLGEQVGETVGYRVRLDTCVGPKTRIEVITEGILTRLLHGDPSLENVGIVIFDEFHERNIHADLGLALCLQSQALLREELKILVMSATLDTAPVSSILGDAPVVISEGKSYPVETYYNKRPIQGHIESAVAQKVQEALLKEQGDILVFLPGVREIRRVESQLLTMINKNEVFIYKLYGTLPQEEQDLALLPAPAGKRKVVLATSIAETSITVQGVRIVIDSGLMRVSRFSPGTGMAHLETVKVSRGAADQRRGRAGRLTSGICYRLWTLQEDLTHRAGNTPEILEADLTTLALELALWGIEDPEELLWLDPPPKGAIAQARELLQQLGALSRTGRITVHGQQMAEVGIHPRLSHMILKGKSFGYGKLACEIAALLSQRDLFQDDKSMPDADLRLRIEVLHNGNKLGIVGLSGYRIDSKIYQRIQVEIRHWTQLFSISGENTDDVCACGVLLALAYPDRIGQGRGDGRFLLRNGRGATFIGPQSLAQEPYLVAAELGGDQLRDNRIFLGSSIDVKEIRQYFNEQIEIQEDISWDHEAQIVRARRYEKLGALILENTPIVSCDPAKLVSALLEGIREEGLKILPWTKAALQLRQRLAFMYFCQPNWPDVSEEALLATLEDWLGPYLYGKANPNRIEGLNLVLVLRSMLTWEQGQQLDNWAPTHIVVPSGQRIPIDYNQPSIPVLAVRLQEMFGLEETPRIGQGKVALTLHLLSPAQRPIQITQDLASFWKNTYFEVKKDLMGRYPKHAWPEDPLKAMATHRTRSQLK